MESNYIIYLQSILDTFVEQNSSHIYSHNIQTVKKQLDKVMSVVAPVTSAVLELKNYGLLESDSKVDLEERMFFITSKGFNIQQNGGLIKFFEDLEEKDQLELKILQQTNDSYKLNNYQFIITFILALGTVIGLFFQWSTYEMEKNKNVLEKQKIELEIKKLKSEKLSILLMTFHSNV